jgi:hypothetical protein
MKVGRWLVSVLGVTMAGCASHGAEPGPCNTLVDDGPPIEYTTGPAPAPAAMGGTPAAGSYALSALIKYTTAAATFVPQGTYSEVLQIEGNTMQSAGTESGAFARNTSTFTISGTTISSVDTCPAHDAWIHDFTATTTELRFYNGNTIDTLEQVYTKR